MDEALLKELCNNLNNRGGLMPAAPIPELFALLEELFTEEEARIACMMPPVSTSLQELASILGSPSEVVHPRLESMADKGIVATRVQDNITLYKLLALAPGIFEFQFMRGGKTDRDRRLAKLFRAFSQAMDNQEQSNFVIPTDLTPGMRVIPVEEAIEAGQNVYTFEQISRYIDSADAIAVGHCYCHHEAYLLGEETCDAPEYRCMSFGPGAVYTSERGIARMITKEEAREIVKECADKGLVHMSSNTSEYLEYLCNCCSCHCGTFKRLAENGQLFAVASSAYIAIVNREICSGCGECAQICPVKAVALEGDVEIAAINELLCIGCGLCSYHCPIDAISMKLREGFSEPPETAKDLRKAIISDFMRAQQKA